MRRKFQILLTIATLVIFMAGIFLFTVIVKNYIGNEVVEQAITDNKVIGLEIISLLQKTGLDKNYSETDSLLQYLCDSVKLPNGGFICATDSLGNLLVAPGLKPGMSMLYSPKLSQFANSGSINITDLPKNDSFIGYANFIKENRLDVIVSLPVNENIRLFIHQNEKTIHQRSDKYLIKMFLIGFVISLFASSVVFYETNKLVKNFENKFEVQNKEIQNLVKENEASQRKLPEPSVNENTISVSPVDCEDKQKSISDSIRYAKRIQEATLSKSKIDGSVFSEHFILFMPRDVVSGDFYWYHDFENYFIIALADCTGHGVPGAFMSMIGITFLNEIILDEQVYDAAKILDQMRKDVILALDQENDEAGASDGMDISICIFNKKKRTLQFAGAYHPLIWIRKGALFEFKGNRMPIGIYGKMGNHFTNHYMEFEKNDVIYMFSDGYADQFGGSKGRKFLINNLKRLLLEIKDLPLETQKHILQETIIKWQGNNLRVDDIAFIGLKIN